MKIRSARPEDIPAIAGFEVEIARVSFGEDAVTDLARHESRLATALERDPDGTLVAEADDGAIVGWLWMSVNKNFLTGEPYATFRSLAVSDRQDRTEIARGLMEAGLAYARSHGVDEVVGKVHSSNTPMRLLYREFGFEATHLSMRLRT